MERVNRRTVLTAGSAVMVTGLAGCVTVRKQLGLLSPGDVMRWKSVIYSEYGTDPPADAPDRDRGIWWQVENVSEKVTVAEAAYTLVARTETETVVEETVDFSDLAPGQSEEWYFELSEETTNNVRTREIQFETFEIA